LWLVNSDDGTNARIVQAVAIYDPLPAPDVVVVLENVIRPDHRRVDFYSDLLQNRMLDPPQMEMGRLVFPDHMWRVTLDESGVGRFVHSTDFTDIVNDDPAEFALGDLRLRIAGLADLVDRPAHVRVRDPLERQVGYYFLGSITGDAIDIVVPGIIDDGTEYRVTFEPGDAPPRCIVERGRMDGLTIDGPLESFGECQ
ncbi:MAG TPA: hypothetical protein VIL20_04240, partial [Sandaracinaceae bacterium]